MAKKNKKQIKEKMKPQKKAFEEGIKEEKETKEETELKKNLQNPLFVNYNLLSKLEEIKKIDYAILEILNFFYQKVISEESVKEPIKEERQGTFKGK